MNYNALIEKIMPEVDSGSEQPIMIYRDIHGDWHGDFTQNQYGDEFDWVEEIQDPFAVTITGEDMSRGSFPYVYDRILNERLRAEYENGFFQDADPAQLNAIMNMFEENMGEFSSEVTDYLTTLERPLAAVYDMTLISLKSSDPDLDYDHDKVGYFVDAIEAEVEERLNNRKKRDISDNQENTITFNDNGKEITVNPDDYTILQSQQIHHRLITLSENPKTEHRYMVCEYWETPRGVNKHMESGITNDYLEALEKYTGKVHYLVSCSISERDTSKRMAKPPTQQELYEQAVADDKFYLRDDGQIEQLYYNPDGYGGKGQYVSDNYSYQDILDAATQADGSVKKFFEHFYGVSKQYLIDNDGGNEFKAEESRFYGDKHDLMGCTEETASHLVEFARAKEKVMEVIKEPGVFEYGGYHFKPYRQFRKNEVDKQLDTDSRPWKKDVQYAMRNMSTDFVLGLSTYEWKRAGTSYSHESFYKASGNNEADIFKCIENELLYAPGENELFLYNESPYKSKFKKASLSERIESGKEKVRETDKNKVQTGKQKSKNKGVDIDG